MVDYSIQSLYNNSIRTNYGDGRRGWPCPPESTSLTEPKPCRPQSEVETLISKRQLTFFETLQREIRNSRRPIPYRKPFRTLTKLILDRNSKPYRNFSDTLIEYLIEYLIGFQIYNIEDHMLLYTQVILCY